MDRLFVPGLDEFEAPAPGSLQRPPQGIRSNNAEVPRGTTDCQATQVSGKASVGNATFDKAAGGKSSGGKGAGSKAAGVGALVDDAQDNERADNFAGLLTAGDTVGAPDIPMDP